MPEVRSPAATNDTHGDSGRAWARPQLSCPYELHLSLTRGSSAMLERYQGPQQFRRPLIVAGWTPLADVVATVAVSAGANSSGGSTSGTVMSVLVVVMEVRRLHG